MLVAAGSVNHCINGGGDVQCAGRAEPGRPWQVGIADPLRPGELAGVVQRRGDRRGHIGDGRAGQPYLRSAHGLVAEHPDQRHAGRAEPVDRRRICHGRVCDGRSRAGLDRILARVPSISHLPRWDPMVISRALNTARVDFAASDRQPSAPRVVAATIVAIAGSLAADALLVVIGEVGVPVNQGIRPFPVRRLRETDHHRRRHRRPGLADRNPRLVGATLVVQPARGARDPRAAPARCVATPPTSVCVGRSRC